jgi:hypothetical protein
LITTLVHMRYFGVSGFSMHVTGTGKKCLFVSTFENPETVKRTVASRSQAVSEQPAVFARGWTKDAFWGWFGLVWFVCFYF